MKKIVTLILAFALLLLLPSCGSSSETGSQEKEETPETVTEQVFYEDDILKATFVDVIEQEIAPGNAYIRVAFENKSDHDISVFPSESSVNDTMVQYFSGTFATMKAGKKLNYAWFFPFENAGISSVEEIEKLEFSLEIDDENMHQIVKTDMITIEVNSQE